VLEPDFNLDPASVRVYRGLLRKSPRKQHEMLAFVGACYDRDDPVPFNPFVEIRESAFAQTRDPAQFRETLASKTEVRAIDFGLTENRPNA